MKRSASLDYARFLAAIGIIVFHVGTVGASIAYAALPFFLLLLMVVAFPAADRLAFKAYARTRAIRLLRPWVIWSLVYGILKLADAGLTETTLQSEFASWMLLTGPSLHLWFLPFALAACLVVWPLAKFSGSLSTRSQVACAALGVVLAVLIAWAFRDLVPTPPFAQWLFALPAVALGTGFGCLRSMPHSAFVTGTCTGVLAGALWLTDWPSGSTQMVLASAAFAMCLALPLRDRPSARWLADLSLPLYLAHPLVIVILLRSTYLEDESPELAVCAVIATILVALVLQARRRTEPGYLPSKDAK